MKYERRRLGYPRVSASSAVQFFLYWVAAGLRKCKQAERIARPECCCDRYPQIAPRSGNPLDRDYFFFAVFLAPVLAFADFLAAFLAISMTPVTLVSDARLWGIGHTPLRHPTREATAQMHQQAINKFLTSKTSGLRHMSRRAYIDLWRIRQAQSL